MTELTDENDLRLKKIREADDKRFFIKSMFRLVQFCGRSVRGKEDYAKTKQYKSRTAFIEKKKYLLIVRLNI